MENDEDADGQPGPEAGKKDIKLAEFALKENAVLLIKKTNYNGEDRIDFRVWLDSPRYKGPTKQGFVVTMDKIKDFMGMMDDIKKKLGKTGDL